MSQLVTDQKAMLPVRVTKGSDDLTPVVDSGRLSGQGPRNGDWHQLALREQKSTQSGAVRNPDNLTRVVDALSVRTGSTRYIDGEKAAVSEKKAVKCAPVIGERTDDVAVIVDAKRSSQEGSRNCDAGNPSRRQEKPVVAGGIPEVSHDLTLVVDTESICQGRTRKIDRSELTARQKETMFPGTIKELPNDVPLVVQSILRCRRLRQ